MAGNRIKGITVEIGGDTTKLQTALKGALQIGLDQLETQSNSGGMTELYLDAGTYVKGHGQGRAG